jgi:predicted small metal-binding protein
MTPERPKRFESELPQRFEAELPQRFELRCDDVHPVRCNLAIRASSSEELTDRMCAHGAMAHGFTPNWYHPVRIAIIAQACAA